MAVAGDDMTMKDHVFICRALHDCSLPLNPSDMKTTIYFKLTHLEDAGKPNKHTQLVDPSVTKMIQSGLEHSRVPPKLKRNGTALDRFKSLSCIPRFDNRF